MVHRMELVILIGLQAAGKTTFRQRRFDRTHIVVSKDNFSNNRSPARRQQLLVREALAAGKPVVVDNTNPRREDRALLIALAREFSVRAVGYFLPATVAESLERNARRVGRARVPDVGVFSTAKAFEIPSWLEGFDELYEVVADTGEHFVVRAMPKETV